jgi:hypothetical protein
MVRFALPSLAVAAITLAACARQDGTGSAPVVVARAEHASSPTPSPPRSEPAPPSGKEALSRQLGGMRLGMTADEFILACQSGGGLLSRADEINLACSAPPAPLKASGSHHADLGGRVAGKFCGPDATICELAYVFDADNDEQTAAVVDMLVNKYGPPSMSDGHAGSDPMARCQKDRFAHFARVWTFGPTDAPPHPVSSARLVFDCDLRVTSETHKLTLFYDDENGVRHRAGEHIENTKKRDNF